MLPVKKIYIDTKKKTADSISNSNFQYEIPETIALPHNTIFYIDDVCIPHSWYTIEDGVNDRIHAREKSLLSNREVPQTFFCAMPASASRNEPVTSTVDGIN